MITYNELVDMCGRAVCMHPDAVRDLHSLQLGMAHHSLENRAIIAEKLLTLLVEYIEQDREVVRKKVH